MAQVKEKKDTLLAYALWCLSFVGICGVQRMYLGQAWLGIVMLFTFGFCGVAQLLDLLLLPGAVKSANQSVPSDNFSSSSGDPLSRRSPSSSAPTEPSQSSFDVSGDEELAMLLEQAEQSFQRTENTLEDS